MSDLEDQEVRGRELLQRFEAATPSLLTLTDDDFEEVVKNAPGVVVVNFFSRGCGQCHKAAALLEQVAATGRPIYKLDCHVSTATAERLFIRSYPKILLFQRGALKEIYDVRPDADAIEAWIARRAGPLQANRG